MVDVYVYVDSGNFVSKVALNVRILDSKVIKVDLQSHRVDVNV